ncbi:MAG: nicotinate-nucleotide adenylyltransferase [Eubacteriales bacterium]|nr:nicotinate-nucleotide adenylyltransferase [Eubacteriales bacterium]
MRIGVFGGTFDPIHKAHMEVAEFARDQFELDLVYIVIAGAPPHKQGERTPGEIRYEMVKRACIGRKGLMASDIELKREGKSYTVDTLKEFRRIHPSDELFLIIGADMLASFESWYKPDEILQSVQLIAVGRMNIDTEAIAKHIGEKYGSKVLISSMLEMDISSTQIRDAVKNARSISGLVEQDVAIYIYESGCYMEPEYNLYRQKLQKDLAPQRYLHSIGTSYYAVELACFYGADSKKARIAGLLHDCAKLPSYQAQIALAIAYHMPDTVIALAPALLHAPLSGVRAKCEYDIDDVEIINAIDCHTTGRENMTLLDKIIFVADKAEPVREYEEAGELRKLVFGGIDKAVLFAMDRSIEHAKSKGGKIDNRTQIARESIIKSVEENQ